MRASSERLRGYLMVGSTAVMFGATGVWVGMTSLPASTLLLLRMALAAVLVIALGGGRRWLRQSLRPGVLRRMLVLGVVDALQLYTFILALRELDEGTFVEPTDVTVAEYLRTYHAEHARHHSAARSHESSGYLLEAHIIPGLGGLKLAKLRPADLQRYYAAQLDLPRAPSSVRKDHNYLHSSLKHAVMMQLLATNPADFVVPPRVTRKEMKVLDEAQSAAMLRAAEGTDLHMPLLLALGTGMRRS
jgi:hypothetical protein